jgi:hypothetical protein
MLSSSECVSMFVISYVPSIGILDFKFIRMCLNVCYIVCSLYWDSRFYVHLNLLNVCYIEHILMNLASRIPIEGTYDITNIETDSDELKI